MTAKPRLKFQYGYKRGVFLYETISREIIGRIGTSKRGCQVLAEVVSRVPDGIHVEIGSQWGGTAILAAMIQSDKGRVFAIDPVGKNGYYGGICPYTHISPSDEIMTKNFLRFGVDEKIKHISEFSHPFPINTSIDTAFIDGDHSYPTVLHDWVNVRERATRYVVFDNVEKEFPDVEDVFTLACNDSGWELAALVEEVGVVRRVK